MWLHLRFIPLKLRYWRLLILLLDFAQLGRADEHVLEHKVQSALNAMYNYDYDRAHALFREVNQSSQFHPLAPLAELATAWLRDQELIGFADANARLLTRVDATLAVYQNHLERRPNDAKIYFYLGTTMGLKARVALARKEWLSVLSNGYRAVNFIRQAERINPSLDDLQLPFGVFNYYVGVSAGYMKIASWLLHTSGDREEGIRQIRLAAEQARYGKYEARGILAFIYIYMEGEPAQALPEAQRLSSEFPHNPYYHFLLAECYIVLGELKMARSEIETLRQLLPHLRAFTLREYQARLHLLEGEMAFASHDWNKAENELLTFVQHYELETDTPLSGALLRLGQIADLQGKREKAIFYYRRGTQLNNRTVACRQANYYLSHPFSLN